MSSGDTSGLRVRRIIGIDLGTTKSGVSIWDEQQGRAVMLADASGRSVMPSLVGWDRVRQEWVEGHTAKELAREHPGDVIYSIKRYIGRWFHDPQVRNGRGDLTYRLVSGGGKDKLCDVIADLGTDDHVGSLLLSAPEVSAKVLARLRQNSAEALGVPREEVEEAIITVPAYFNMLHRQATVLAGQKAGLKVVDILNEPIAAALAYGEVVLGPEERRILVYDLGGGTFDVAILEARRDEQGYEFFTRVIDGDTRLGGDDIDASVVRFLAEQIRTRFGHPVRPDDWVTRAQLRWHAEQAKIDLSEPGQELAVIDLPALDLGSCSPFDARLELTRDQLEACAADVLSRTRAITQRAVKEVAGLTWDQIDEVILVGGQTLMPAIQRDVEALTGASRASRTGRNSWSPWERAGNNFPISHWLGNSPIVPLGEKLVEHNLHGLLESRGILPARLVHLVKDAHLDLEALLRFGLRHVVPNGLERVEDHSATRPGQVGEQAVLNRIPLRAVRRVVGHANLDAKPVRQLLKVFFEQIHGRAIAAAAIA